jgi:hypothetical protein
MKAGDIVSMSVNESCLLARLLSLESYGLTNSKRFPVFIKMRLRKCPRHMIPR